MAINATAYFEEDSRRYRARFWSHELKFNTARWVDDAFWIEDRGMKEPPRVNDPKYLKLAQTWADRQAVAIEKDLRAKPKSSKKDLAATWELYKKMNPNRVTPDTIKRSEISAKKVFAFIEEKRLGIVNPDDVDIAFATELRNWLEEGGAATKTILNDLTWLKQMCKFAVEWHSKTGCEAQRLVSLPKLDEINRGVYRALSEDDYGRFREACRPMWRRIFDNAVTTRLRRKNVLRSRGEWYDREDKWLTIARAEMKGGERKVKVDLSAPVAQWTIDTLGDVTAGWLFPNEQTGEPFEWVEYAFEEALAKAGIPKVTSAGKLSFHSWRATGTTWLDHAGVDEFTLKVLDNRAMSPDALNLYRKRFTGQLREAVDVYDQIRRRNGW
jgi:integrase